MQLATPIDPIQLCVTPLVYSQQDMEKGEVIALKELLNTEHHDHTQCIQVDRAHQLDHGAAVPSRVDEHLRCGGGVAQGVRYERDLYSCLICNEGMECLH